jgi:hypothetical protein
VLRRTFGSEREEVTGERRNFHNEELHKFYSSPNARVIKSERTRWVWYLAHMRENAYKIVVRKPEDKRPL